LPSLSIENHLVSLQKNSARSNAVELSGIAYAPDLIQGKLIIMKKILLFVCSFCLGASLYAQKHSLQNLIGRWESEEGGGIEVMDSAHIFMVYGNEKKPISSYQADFSHSPAWFDFSIVDSGQTITMKSLMQFVNRDEVKWQVFDDGTRPVNFTIGKGEIVYLRRKK
jgi:hypothetical protein